MRILYLCFIPMVAACACSSGGTKHALIEGFNLKAAEREKLESEVAFNHDADAAERLGQYYLLVERDNQRAAFWLKKAAEIGNDHYKEVYKSFVDAMADNDEK